MNSVGVSNRQAGAPIPVFYQPLWARITLLIILGYEGVGCLAGGILLMTAPDGHYMDMPVDIMHGVFRDFLTPGIILFGLGILNTFAWITVFRRKPLDWMLAGLALGGLLIWFIVEIIILQELHWLHLMWGLPVLVGWVATFPLLALRHPTPAMLKFLLFCGILSSLWYVAINILVPIRYDEYSIATFTVSELSAIGAPTRLLWVLLCLFYSLTFAAFGWGVLLVAKENKHLHWVGSLILIYCIFGFYWPPMHMRGNEATLTDTLHIVWAIITNIFMWLFMGFGAAALSRNFRMYTIASILSHLIIGALTVMEAPNIVSSGPTPTIGIWERINIGIFMLWVVVFALLLIRKIQVVHTLHFTSPPSFD